MLNGLIAAAAVGLGCMGWYLVQRWAGALDDDCEDEIAVGGCGGCSSVECDQRQP